MNEYDPGQDFEVLHAAWLARKESGYIDEPEPKQTKMNQQNQTKQEAITRVINARVGSLTDNPSQEYLTELREQLFFWLQEIHNTIVPEAFEPISDEELMADPLYLTDGL